MTTDRQYTAPLDTIKNRLHSIVLPLLSLVYVATSGYAAASLNASSFEVDASANQTSWVPVTLNWDSVAGAAAYRLEEKAVNSSWSEVFTGSSSNTTFDRQPGDYKYRVIACINDANANLLCNNTVANYSDELDVTVGESPVDAQWNAKGGFVSDAPFVASTQDTTNFYGITPTQAGVSGGAASFSIPVELPPGRNNIQPTVSLNYSSRSGASIAGVGWSLSAGGAISRCAPTTAQDNFTDGIEFNESTDKLCLNGQRLIAVDGNYGQSGTEYKTELDSFSRIFQRSGSLNSTSTYFEVIHANGAKEYFGQSDESKVIPTNRTETLSWQLTRMEDVSTKNHMTYNYIDYGDGEKLLSSIVYTGDGVTEGNRRVEFRYDANQALPSTSFIYGGFTRQTKLLTHIDTYYSTSLVKQYTLEYASSNSNATGRSLLESVQACDTDDNCQNAITFEWQQRATEYDIQLLQTTDTQEELVPVDNYLPLMSMVMPRGDADGNGSRDWPHHFINAEGNKLGDNPYTYESCDFNIIIRSTVCLEGDFDLDGQTDPWYIHNNQLRIQMGNNIVDTNIVIDEEINSSASDLVNIADYNGDGWPDLIVHEAEQDPITSEFSGPIVLYLHTQNANLPYNESQILANSNTYGTVDFVGDMNGDGLADLAINKRIRGGINSTATLETLLLTNVNTSGVVSFESFDLNDNSSLDAYEEFSLLADVNGDGLRDWLGWISGELATLFLRLNHGDGTFGEPIDLGISLETRQVFAGSLGNGELANPSFVPLFSSAIKPMDVNGDGRAELIIPGHQESDIVAEACYTFNELPRNSGVVSTTACGTELRGNYDTRNNGQTIQNAMPSTWDRNIYRYYAIHIDETLNGSFSARKTQTALIGGVNDTTVIDAFGKGLDDLVFAYGCHDQACEIRSATGELENEAINKYYVNRNFGSGTATSLNDDYAARDLLIAADNGNEMLARWQYRPLSHGENGDFYSVDRAHVNNDSEHFFFASSMYAVKSFWQSNAVGSENRTDYNYESALYNTQGRGFRGFLAITVTNRAQEVAGYTAFKTRTEFLQKFPYSSLIDTQTQYQNSLSQYVSKTENQWEDNPAHSISNVYHIFNSNSVAEKRDLDGTTTMSVTTTTVNDGDIDEFGNIERRSIEINEPSAFGTYTTIEEADYSESNQDWPHRLSSKVVTKSVSRSNGPSLAAGAQTTKTVVTNIAEYDEVHRKPSEVTVGAGSTPLSMATCNSTMDGCIATTTTYNSYGLPTHVSVQGRVLEGISDTQVLQTRATTTTYTKNGTNTSADGYFPRSITQENGSIDHITTVETSPNFGVPVKVTEVNGVIKQTQIDGFGRPTSVSVTGMPSQYLRYTTPESGAPSHAIMAVKTTQAGTPNTVAYIDALGRTIRTKVADFSTGYLISDTNYDALGRVANESAPYKSGTPVRTYYTYDVLNRVTEKTSPATYGSQEDLTTSYRHDAFTTTIETSAPDGANLYMSRQYNSLNQLMSTTDDQNGETRYAYDGAGNPIVINDALNNSIFAFYDDLGRKLRVNDPNQGETRFTYNDFGELEKENDANNAYIRYDVDKLGRVYLRLSDEGTANYEWDTNKVGLLTEETLAGNSKTFNYDYAGRLTTVDTRIDNQVFTVTTLYDNGYGRIKSVKYPNELTLAYEYNTNGYPTTVKNAESNYVYRQITAQDVWGNISQAQLGENEMIGNYLFSSRTGQMLSTRVNVNGVDKHYLDYVDYDSYGNLKEVHNLVQGYNAEETYQYDSLQRLTESRIDAGNISPITIEYDYDAVGNLKMKTDYSASHSDAYEYTPGTNKVARVDKPSGADDVFGYDEKGNLTHRNGQREVTYNSFNKPTQISRLGSEVALAYGADLMRLKQVRSVNGGPEITTYYIDKLYEVEVEGDQQTTTAYIEDFALVKENSRTASIRFTHKDRLGSTTTVMDENGTVTAYRSFDPFGKPKGGDWVPLSSNAKLATIDNDMSTRRGFTDHEHLDEVELIHMNGRVYDYNLGRFMSVDPFVQAPGNSQSINPYSYIMNNPLAGTDPSGYASCTGSRINGTSCATTGAKVIGTPDDFDSVSKKAMANVERAISTMHNGSSLQNEKNVANVADITEIESPITTSQTTVGSTTDINNGNNKSKTPAGTGSLGETVKGVATEAVRSLKRGGAVGLALAPTMMGDGELSDAQNETIQKETDEMLSNIRQSDGGVILYHGTDIDSARALFAGAPLEAEQALRSRHPNHSAADQGFYLATHVDVAHLFGSKQGGLKTSGDYAVLAYYLSNKALNGLYSQGAHFRNIAPGKNFNPVGKEFLVPRRAFPTFNRLRSSGEIRVSPALE